jgi:hypothetical protein
MKRIAVLVGLLAVVMGVGHWSMAAEEAGFVPLFDGQSLSGWKFMGKNPKSYEAKEGVLSVMQGCDGNLVTEKQFADYVLRFEFKLEEGSNNGIGVRTPMTGDAAYMGMEIQILDEMAAVKGKWGTLRPGQYHGSIYDVVPAKRGALKPPGEWNEEEISAIGRRITVVVNGQTIVEADLNTVADAAVLGKHPGLLRERGHISLCGHTDPMQFRNIRIKDLSAEAKDNTPPEGFVAVFNGKDLSGWKGLLAGPNDNPVKRGQLAAEPLAAAQAEADQNMKAHWKVEDGALVFDGKGRSLCTAKDYGDFEMLVDWKILPKGDSGIYLRGSPQVQIWDNPIGSGGLFNNQKNPSKPTKALDRPVGEWNRFRILMQGEKVTVFLNGELVFRDVTMENYWDRNQPIFPTGQIELQNHENALWFKNVYIRELPRK